MSALRAMTEQSPQTARERAELSRPGEAATMRVVTTDAQLVVQRGQRALPLLPAPRGQ